MRRTTLLALAIAVALGGTALRAVGQDSGGRADALWAAREDPSKANAAVAELEAALAGNPSDFEILLRLSRLHYWIGQCLEETDEKAAIGHFERGEGCGARAAECAPAKPGGHFFRAANMARAASLKGRLASALRASDVRALNEKVESIQRDYFYSGPDRFFCAYYARLPGLLGGDLKKAVQRGRRAVETHPEYAGNRLYLAEAYFKDGRNDLARKELEAAMATPDSAVPDAVPEQRMEKKRAAALYRRIGK